MGKSFFEALFALNEMKMAARKSKHNFVAVATNVYNYIPTLRTQHLKTNRFLSSPFFI